MPQGVIVDVDVLRRVVLLPLGEVLLEAPRGRRRAVCPVPGHEGSYGVPPLAVAFSGGEIVIPGRINVLFVVKHILFRMRWIYRNTVDWLSCEILNVFE